MYDQKRRILYTKRQTLATKWGDIILCDIKHDVCVYMCEHAPNVRVLLEELKLETHLEHSISPCQFDRTEGTKKVIEDAGKDVSDYLSAKWNASNNARLVIRQEQIIDGLKKQNDSLNETIKLLKTKVQLYEGEFNHFKDRSEGLHKINKRSITQDVLSRKILWTRPLKTYRRHQSIRCCRLVMTKESSPMMMTHTGNTSSLQCQEVGRRKGTKELVEIWTYSVSLVRVV
jgi:hypothetical protein